MLFLLHNVACIAKIIHRVPNKKLAFPSAHLFQIEPKNKVIATVIIISAAAIPGGNVRRHEAAGDMYSGKADDDYTANEVVQLSRKERHLA